MSLRITYITNPLFKMLKSKGLLPKISDTEKTALRAGDVWVEGELFSGKPDFKKIFSYPYPTLSLEEKSFLDKEVEKVCTMTDDWEVFQKRDLSPKVWNYLKKQKFLGMIIPKEYGGLGFSAYGHSCVIEKLATRSQVLAITTMVPNSLGPAELLLHYGTKKQKEHYLPRLADGREIPCFALTEPNAGSDAASIQSYGELFKDSKGKLKIKLQFEKRYITLSAIATLIGLAFVLKDPDKLLGDTEDLGITCALVDAKKEGIDQSQRHDPLGVPFVNAPLLGKDVIIDIDDIIGGKEGIAQGWKMLMESLAVGRGISLPSTSTGGTKLATMVASTYSVVRYQFGLSISKFEGIAEVLGRMGADTYLLDAAKTFTLGAIDSGEKPAVANAIMKYQSTEKFRNNILDAMDIQGGAAISMGPKNLLAHAYFGAPVAITVEGANIMTRTLIQFGQGMIRCHPYAYAEIEALEKEDISTFDKMLFAHIFHVLKNSWRAFLLFFSRGYLHTPAIQGESARYEQKLAWTSAKFAFLSDVALGLMGADLKRRESVSGRFGDILAQMYMMTAALKRYQVEGGKKEAIFLKVAMQDGFNQIDHSFAGIYENLATGVLRYPFKILGFFSTLNPLGGQIKDKDLHAIAALLGSDETLRGKICSNVFVGDKKERIYQLIQTASLMNENKTLLKKENLDKEEIKTLKALRKAQQNIVSVDAFTQEEYLK